MVTNICLTVHFADLKLHNVAEEGTVRLVGGPTPLEGRVEIFFFHQWGTFCTSYWDLADATVVCHQLGYLRAVGVHTFEAGGGPSWYYSVECVGTEKNLTECSRSFALSGNACPHSQDAGVVCSSGSKLVPCIVYILLTPCCNCM